MVSDLQFLIDGFDRGQPVNVENFGCQIVRDRELNIVYVKFDNPLTFNGGVYEYIYARAEANQYCGLIDVTVNYKCQGNYSLLTKGYIDITDCVFNLDKCELTSKIIDDSFASRINNNKSIVFYTNSNKTKNLYDVTPPTPIPCVMFTPGSGALRTENPQGLHIYNVFTHLVNCMSDNNVSFVSDFFSTGNGRKYFVTNGLALRTNNNNSTKLSFKQLFDWFNKKLNLGIGFERDSFGRPAIRIEEADYFYNSSPIVTLLDVGGVEQYFDKESLFSTVQFGSDQVLEEYQCDQSNSSCTYPQIEFRGNRVETFGVLGECNLDKTLSLQVDTILYDYNVIEDVIIYQSQDYDLNPFIIECQPAAINTGIMAALLTDPLGLGLWVYNGGLTNEQTAAAWLGGVPNTIFSYLEPFDDTQLPAQVSGDGFYYDGTVDGCGSGFAPFNSVPLAFKVPAINVGFANRISYSGSMGVLIGFNDIISDPGTNWVNDTINFNTYYRAPVPLIGDFRIQIAISGSPSNQAGLVVFTRIVLKRFSEDGGNLIQFRTGSFQNFFARDTTCSNKIQMDETFTGVFMNSGDRIYADVEAYLLVTPTLGGDQLLRINSTNSGFFTQFTAQNMQSIKGGELQEYNPDDYKATLYKFDLPISHQDIASMIQEPSKAVMLGRTPDPLNVKTTNINSVNIASILRKDANFELISSE